jgi:hypothetical protein
MEQEPYEFRIRPAKLESKGKATYGAFREHAIPRFKKVWAEFSALGLTACLGVRLARLEFHQERPWAIKKQ